MVPFEYWGESIKFTIIYTFIIAIPCVIVALLGKKMIAKLGRYPSKTPAIQMSVFWQLILLEFITFGLLIGFFQLFAQTVPTT